MKRTVVFLIFLALLTGTAWTKEKDKNRGLIQIAGFVMSPATGTSGLPDVTVEIIGTDHKASTNERGQFFFTKAPEGELTLRISKAGFQTAMRKAKVKRDSLEPPNIFVELLPDGTSTTGRGVTGPGTLHVSYRAGAKYGPIGPDGNRLSDWDIRRRLAINPNLVWSEHHSPELLADPKRPSNPYNLALNHIMVYPPKSPGRTSFHNLKFKPSHLAFDAGGQHLYVADQNKQITIYDENDNREVMGRFSPKGLITDLCLSEDGKWIYATILSAQSSILALNTQTHQAAASLPLSGLGNASPNTITPLSQDVLLVAAGSQSSAGSLLFVDAYTGATQASVPVGKVPTSIAVTPDKKLAYVANSHSGNVTVVDLGKREALGFIRVGVGPQRCAVTPDGKRVLVTNKGSDTVSVIDTSQQALTGFVRVGKAPIGLAITPDGQSCYVTNQDSGNVSTIDVGSLKQVHVSDPMPMSSPLDIIIRP